ncbi:hypothetical protein CVT26_000462 [Gymnopilus dilepis]|uniref:Uncharacterized protein n=1 Tax=Gymnopilus dilepis TaxID=231916 RepID=A0A409Y2C2_9AGAR|nr:hypothetical protein CVT26_000462 [Gymnopilus dilepis]
MLRLWNLPHRSDFGAATWAEHGDLDKLVSPPEEARYGQEPVNRFAEIIARAFGCPASEMTSTIKCTVRARARSANVDNSLVSANRILEFCKGFGTVGEEAASKDFRNCHEIWQLATLKCQFCFLESEGMVRMGKMALVVGIDHRFGRTVYKHNENRNGMDM